MDSADASSSPARGDEFTSAVRALRSAPAATLGAVARSTGESVPLLRQRLAQTQPRGRCAQAVAGLLHQTSQHRLTPSRALRHMELLTHRACPPSATRATMAVLLRMSGADSTVPGTLGWPVRNSRSAESAPGSLMRASAASDDSLMRCGVAQNPALAPVLATALASDSQWSVLSAIAANPACPREILRMFAHGKLPATSVDTGLPASIHKKLHETMCSELREAALQNPACPSLP